MEVWCSELQIRQSLLLRQSEALCFAPVQSKQRFFWGVFACDFLHFLLTRTGLLYDLACLNKHMDGVLVFALLFEKHLPIYVFDHYLMCF